MKISLIVQKKCALVSCLVLCASVALGEVHYVDVNNLNPSHPFTNWMTAATTIQHAVESAIDGDTVLVTDGVYRVGSVRTPGRSALNRVLITNAIKLVSQNGPEVTVIEGEPDPLTLWNGSNGMRCVFFGEGAEVSGFTLTNGYTQADGTFSYDLSGGGALMSWGGILTNCIIVGNHAGYYGAGVYCRSNGLVVDCMITGNEADDTGAGGFCFNGAEFRDCTIINNIATNLVLGGAGYAGGVYVYLKGVVTNCLISDNNAVSGAGVFMDNGGLIVDCTITSNDASDYAGGVYCWGPGRVSHCNLRQNSAGVFGGGTLVYDVGGEIVDCVLEENATTGGYGGGAVLYYGGTMNRCLVQNNTTAWYGAGAYLGYGGELNDCLVVRNEAGSRAGGVYALQGGMVQNSTITSNSAVSYGGGVYCDSGGTFLNSIVAFNSAPTGTNYYNSGTGESYSYCCTDPAVAGSSNLAVDPLFVNPGLNHYSLQAGSPCVDAGQPGIVASTDLDGIGRPLDGNNDTNTVIDLGAYEYIHPLADSDGDGLVDTNELEAVGSNPAEADTDGDEQDDGREVLAGTDPLDPLSLFKLEETPQLTEDGFVVSWFSVAGKVYALYRATNLMAGFSSVATNLAATPPMNIYTDEVSDAESFFYTVRVGE